MNIKFVVGGLAVIGALYFGSDIYWQHQFKEETRTNLKNFSMSQEMQDATRGLPIKADILNQYPNIFFYMTLTQDIPRETEALVKSTLSANSQKFACGFFAKIQNQGEKNKDKTKAIVNVIEEDKVTMTYIAKTRMGQVLLEYKQVLSQCPEFNSLKQSVV